MLPHRQSTWNSRARRRSKSAQRFGRSQSKSCRNIQICRQSHFLPQQRTMLPHGLTGCRRQGLYQTVENEQKNVRRCSGETRCPCRACPGRHENHQIIVGKRQRYGKGALGQNAIIGMDLNFDSSGD